MGPFISLGLNFLISIKMQIKTPILLASKNPRPEVSQILFANYKHSRILRNNWHSPKPPLPGGLPRFFHFLLCLPKALSLLFPSHLPWENHRLPDPISILECHKTWDPSVPPLPSFPNSCRGKNELAQCCQFYIIGPCSFPKPFASSTSYLLTRA